MDIALLKTQQNWIRDELSRTIEFWLKHGWDHQNGGVYTCLGQQGEVLHTDKSVWMQGRGGWMFSYLCRVYGPKQEWLDFARSCLEFGEQYCVDHSRGRRMYLHVTAKGHPVRWRTRFHSEGFFCIANAEFYGLTGETKYLDRAKAAYELYWNLFHRLIEDPFEKDPLAMPDNRIGYTPDMRTIDLPMIYLNICSVMRRCDPENTALYDARADQCVDEIFRYHRKEDIHCTLETVGPDGEIIDSPLGRQINPGHDIELSWFLMEYANYKGDRELHKKAEDIFHDAYTAGWDEEHGGLLNLLDLKYGAEQDIWYSCKIWWPQTELLIAPLMAYRDTGNEAYHRIFTQALDYCKKQFSDPIYGEWYNGFSRDHTPFKHEPFSKGNPNKGPFHVLRALCMTDKLIDDILNNTPKGE
ncbi:MAG: AGE family epimerase/isomerase [Clostridia bacterium]|nr:AGE family epimerase/isomerase [Clostridia bacterium]